MSNKKRKLNNILTSSYRNYIPLNPNNENRFLVTSTSETSHSSLRTFVAQRKNNLKASGINLPATSMLDLTVPFTKNKETGDIQKEDEVLCSKIDSQAAVGRKSGSNKKNVRLGAFRGRRGTKAKTEQTWLFKTKYIMNDLYTATNGGAAKKRRVASPTSNIDPSNKNFQEVTFITDVFKKHPSKPNVTAVSVHDFIPFNDIASSFHQVQHLNSEEYGKETILRNSDDISGDTLKLKVALPISGNDDNNSSSKEHYENSQIVKLKRRPKKHLDRILYASFMDGDQVYYLPVDIDVILEPCKAQKMFDNTGRLHITRLVEGGD